MAVAEAIRAGLVACVGWGFDMAEEETCAKAVIVMLTSAGLRRCGWKGLSMTFEVRCT
ncbi:hypothetical protein C1H46_018394 [Malus baccata]|uniref:Uncharacterized protein n=1 Tax=Malus baccata TaxID=106549 RepID=A0A540MBW9_MALBA|nr:hypothetical protein C1H46_018394 [Malus baccata]